MSTTEIFGVVLYARQSKGDASVDQQLEITAKRAAERGWPVLARFSDRSVSATKKEPRPGYDAMMARWIRTGKANGIVVRHFDRLYRQPVELEGLIADIEGVHVESVYGGGYDLGTADGRMQARVVGAFARGEAEKKSERQRLGAQRDAKAGKRWTGCPRPFGYEADHVTLNPAEAEAIQEAADAVIGGGSITSVMEEWDARHLVPPQAALRGTLGRWTRNSVTAVLRNPRTAGLSAYKGEIIRDASGEPVRLTGPDGKTPVTPILTREQHEAISGILAGRARRRSQGTRTLLGGLLRCQCGNVVTGTQSTLGDNAYRCQPVTRKPGTGPHCAHRAAPVDAWVTELTLELLSRADFASLITPAKRPDLKPLIKEKDAIVRRMENLPGDQVLGIITRSAMIDGIERGKRRVAEIDARLAEASGNAALEPFLRGDPAQEVWDQLDQSRRRAVIDALWTITLHPAGQGNRNPDMARVVKLLPKLSTGS